MRISATLARPWWSRRVLAAGAAVASVVIMSGCTATAERSIGVDADDVSSVELYFYDFAKPPTSVDRTVIADRGLIDELVDAFTGMPVKSSGYDDADLVGHQTAGVRFVLDDGTTAELTQVFVDFHDVVVIWSDGTHSSTEWGVPLVDYYSDLGVVTPDINPSEVPTVAFDS